MIRFDLILISEFIQLFMKYLLKIIFMKHFMIFLKNFIYFMIMDLFFKLVCIGFL
jgi:hypothetical protein